MVKKRSQAMTRVGNTHVEESRPLQPYKWKAFQTWGCPWSLGDKGQAVDNEARERCGLQDPRPTV